MDSSQVSFGIAFIAGLVSFLSPCMLPLVPIFLAQLVGQSAYQSTDQHENRPARFITFLHAVMFVVGFTLTFVVLGATASVLGSFLRAYQFQLRQIGGIVLILIGLHLAGVLKVPLFFWQKQFTFRPTRPSYPTSLVIGVIFAIGWTPCISLVLGSVLGLAAAAATLRIGVIFAIGWTPCISLVLGSVLGLAAAAATLRQGVLLLLFYSLGMGLPFLLLGLGVNQLSSVLHWLRPHLGKIEVGTGIVMILVGVMIYFNWLVYLNRYAPSFIRL